MELTACRWKEFRPEQGLANEGCSFSLHQPALWKMGPAGHRWMYKPSLLAGTLLGLYTGTQSLSEARRCPSLQGALSPAPLLTPPPPNPTLGSMPEAHGSDWEGSGSLKARLRIRAKRELKGQQAVALKQGTPQTQSRSSQIKSSPPGSACRQENRGTEKEGIQALKSHLESKPSSTNS